MKFFKTPCLSFWKHFSYRSQMSVEANHEQLATAYFQFRRHVKNLHFSPNFFSLLYLNNIDCVFKYGLSVFHKAWS